MLYEGVGNALGVLLPKFQPVTDAEVDQLMDLKIRVKGFDIRISSISLILLNFLIICIYFQCFTYFTYFT